MESKPVASRKITKSSWQNLARGLIIASLLYLASYSVNSFCGGYWSIPERDGRDRYTFGLSMSTAILWQPRIGHEAIGRLNFFGVFYKPLIRLDRKFIHETIYISDDQGFKTATTLPASKVHPVFHDDYFTQIKSTVIFDRPHQLIQCVLHLSGSDTPRSLVEIEMRREVANAWGISQPKGFLEKPYPDNQKFFREKYIRWSGKMPLPRDHDVVLQFSTTTFATNSDSIRFRCDVDKLSEVNHMKICFVRIGEPTSSTP